MPKPLRVILGANIKVAREKQGLTLAQFAAKVGLSESYVSYLETGRRTPSVEALVAIADVVRCTTDELLGRK